MSKVELKKALGFRHVFAASYGLVVCSSTYMAASYGYASEIRAAFTLSCLITLILFIFNGLCLSELATTWPRAGSFAVYVRDALGDIAGMTVATVYFILSSVLAIETIIGGKIMEYVIPQVPWQVWSVICATSMLILNLLGIIVVGESVFIMVALMVSVLSAMSLAYIAGFGVTPFNWERALAIPSWTDWERFWVPTLAWSLPAYWLYVGFEVPGPLSEETKNPGKVIPGAVTCALVFMFVVHVLLGFAAIGALTPEEIYSVPYPHVEAARAMFGPIGMYIVAVIAMISTLSTIEAFMASTSRPFWDMAREGFLPKIFAWLHPRFRTPWTVLLIDYVGILIATFILEKYVFFIILYGSFWFGFVYVMMNISLIILRNKRPDVKRVFSAGGPWKIPIIPLLALAWTVITMYFQYAQDPTGFYVGSIATLAAFAFSVIVCRVYRRKKQR
jgi:amino acid transporter